MQSAQSESRPTQVPRYTHQSLQTRPMEDAAREYAVPAENDRRHAAVSGIIREGIVRTQLPFDEKRMFRSDRFPDLECVSIPDPITSIGQQNAVANRVRKGDEPGPFQYTPVGSIVRQNESVMQGHRGTGLELPFEKGQADALPARSGVDHAVEKIADAAALTGQPNVLVAQAPDGDDAVVPFSHGDLKLGEEPAPFPEVLAFVVETQPIALGTKTGKIAQGFVVPQSIRRAERQVRHLQPARRQDSTAWVGITG